jgi:hypothetical protein
MGKFLSYCLSNGIANWPNFFCKKCSGESNWSRYGIRFLKTRKKILGGGGGGTDGKSFFSIYWQKSFATLTFRSQKLIFLNKQFYLSKKGVYLNLLMK